MARNVISLEHYNLVIFDEARLPPPGLPQWNIFAQARIVLGPHGAGLSNLVACTAPTTTAVVEFWGQGRDRIFCYLTLARSLGLDYYPLFMESTLDGNSSNNVRYQNYTVHVSHVTGVVEQILAAEQTAIQ